MNEELTKIEILIFMDLLKGSGRMDYADGMELYAKLKRILDGPIRYSLNLDDLKLIHYQLSGFVKHTKGGTFRKIEHLIGLR